MSNKKPKSNSKSATAKIKAAKKDRKSLKSAKPAKKLSAKTTASKSKKKSGAKKATAKKVTIKAKTKIADRVIGAVKSVVDKVAEGADGLIAVIQGDVITAIKEDHDSLRNYLDTLKNTEESMQKRRKAYEDFSALLKSHTVAEENAVYKIGMTLPGKEMHIKFAEGFVEHQLADDIMKRMESTEDAMAWSAHANVLSEIVEHHLKEEERDLLPQVRRAADLQTNMDMLTEFLSLRGKTQEKVTADNAGALDQLRE